MIRVSRFVVAPIVAAMVALTAAMPVAAAQLTTVDCAVGYVGGPEWVVLTMGSIETRGGVQDSGAACTELIGGGQFVGADKFKDWELAGYERLCIVSLSNNESAEVHAGPDFDSRVYGYRMCLAGQDVYYFTGSEMTTPTHHAP